jgi:hypothetical protein
MKGFVYSLYTPPVITSNYNAIAISSLCNSCYTCTSPLFVTQLKHKIYNSLTKSHTQVLQMNKNHTRSSHGEIPMTIFRHTVDSYGLVFCKALSLTKGPAHAGGPCQRSLSRVRVP